MPRVTDLSIVIVSFSTRDLTVSCLESLKRSQSPGTKWEIIVVDNDSKDDTVDFLTKLGKTDAFYRSITIVRNSQNLGFSKANNIGIKKSTGTNILLLNSDTEVKGTAIQQMQEFMAEHPKAGVATAKLELEGGKIDPASHRGFPTPWASFCYFLKLEALFPKSRMFSQYHMGYKNMEEAHQIDCPSGAFFLIRRKVIDEIGYLDEEFFMYGEDVDWAYRVKQRGWEIWFNPRAIVLHKKKQSGRAHGDRELRKRTQKYFYETMLLFYRKHYKENYPVVLYYFIRTMIKIWIFLSI